MDWILVHSPLNEGNSEETEILFKLAYFTYVAQTNQICNTRLIKKESLVNLVLKDKARVVAAKAHLSGFPFLSQAATLWSRTCLSTDCWQMVLPWLLIKFTGPCTAPDLAYACKDFYIRSFQNSHKVLRICFEDFGVWMNGHIYAARAFSFLSYILELHRDFVDWKYRFCNCKTICQPGLFTSFSPIPIPQSFFRLSLTLPLWFWGHRLYASPRFFIQSFTVHYHIENTVMGVTLGRDSKEVIKTW